jgi:hypothetical protein
VYLPRTQGISTTNLKQVMSAIRAERLLAVRHAVEHVRMLLADVDQTEEYNGKTGPG